MDVLFSCFERNKDWPLYHWFITSFACRRALRRWERKINGHFILAHTEVRILCEHDRNDGTTHEKESELVAPFLSVERRPSGRSVNTW
jgi:hypothetical protein